MTITITIIINKILLFNLINFIQPQLTAITDNVIINAIAIIVVVINFNI